MANWKRVVLSDVLQNKGYVRGPFGSALKRGELLSEGIPVYEQQHAIYNSRDFRFFVNDSKFDKMRRFQVKENDLIISCSGTVGKVSIIDKDDPKGIISQALLLLRVNESMIDPLYLKYFFTSREGYNAIVSRSSGSVQVNIARRNIIENIPLLLPPIEAQKKIVNILSDFDKMISNKEALNVNLQEHAKALYKRLIIENADETWTSGLLSDIAIITMGQSPKGDTYNEDGVGTVFFQGRAEFGFRFPSRRLYTTDPKRMAQTNDVLLSVRAPVGDLNVAYEECCIGRGLGAIRSNDGHQSFVLYTMYAIRELLDTYNGEGTVFGSINRKALNSLPVEIPPKEVIDKFEDIVSPMDVAIRSNFEEICHLESLRDSLLPKLMTGELDVSEVSF